MYVTFNISDPADLPPSFVIYHSILVGQNRKKNKITSTIKFLLLAGPVEPCDSLFDTESEEAAVVGGRAGGGTSDFSDKFSLRVRRTTVMSD